MLQVNVVKLNAYVRKHLKLADQYDMFVSQGYAGYKSANDRFLTNEQIIEYNNKHVFFGYYDLRQLDCTGSNCLVHIVAKDASPKHDTAEICYYNLKNKNFYRICSTHAWCWQQGSRLRWLQDDRIMLNAVSGKNYITRVYDKLTNNIINEYPVAMYDISEKKQYGISLNFSRLQRLRPGYGYSFLEDITKNDIAPENDGLFKYSFKTGKKELLYSLRSLAADCECTPGDQHYINHVSISPDGNHFLFFHIWAPNSVDMWKMKLYVSDSFGEKLTCLEEKNTISHYCWVNNRIILTTQIKNLNEKCFVIYDIKTGRQKLINNPYLCQDGHPVMIDKKGTFLVDTYPLNNCLQTLFLCKIPDSDYMENLLSIFSDPRLFIEHRCDLHPRYFAPNRLISIDSTFSDGLRKVLVYSLKNDLFSNKK